MKKLLLLLILLFSLNIVIAESVQYGKVKLTVVNRAPRITSLNILPEEPYYDSMLECNAIVEDESPETVTFVYKWYKNNVLLEETSKYLTDIIDNDNIRCSVTPTDKYDEIGNTETAQTTILESPVRVKVIKPVLNIVGIQVSAKDLKQSTSMQAITGMVTGTNSSSDITVVFLLGIFVIILVGLNLTGFVIHLRRKKSVKSPKQGFLSASYQQ